MPTTVFPAERWEFISPAEAGFDPVRLEAAQQWLEERVKEYRFIIVRGGRIAVEWNRGLNRDDMNPQIASATKSIYSNILGIAVADGKIPSADAKVVDFYPEMMDVPEEGGPKPGRYAFPKDRDITFRQLICNTSGYMKPGEDPGQVFHYQTFGMNILTHALAKAYGYYDTNDPEGSPGFGKLVTEKLASPIGAKWRYSLWNFDLQEKARLNIFGYASMIHSTAPDLARVGWLWRNWGRWGKKQIIPMAWMRETVQTAPDIRSNCSQEEWVYGHGFWTNNQGQLWPELPGDGFTASGAGGHYITVFPSQDLVIIQNPGLYINPLPGQWHNIANPSLLKMVIEAL